MKYLLTFGVRSPANIEASREEITPPALVIPNTVPQYL